MIDPHVLLVLLGVLVHDALGLSSQAIDNPTVLFVLAFIVPLVVIVGQHVGIALSTGKLIKSGHPKWVDGVHRVQRIGAGAGVLAYLVALFVFGWLSWVREIIEHRNMFE